MGRFAQYSACRFSSSRLRSTSQRTQFMAIDRGSKPIGCLLSKSHAKCIRIVWTASQPQHQVFLGLQLGLLSFESIAQLAQLFEQGLHMRAVGYRERFPLDPVVALRVEATGHGRGTRGARVGVESTARLGAEVRDQPVRIAALQCFHDVATGVSRTVEDDALHGHTILICKRTYHIGGLNLRLETSGVDLENPDS